MAHNMYFNEQKGEHSFFSVKEKAWHGLGQIVTDYPNSKDALRFAGLDYSVEKRKLYTQRNEYENPQISVPDYSATIRTDTNEVLGVVGKDYEIVQNIDAFSFFDSIVGGDGIQYETAGALGKGERIFITAKLPDYIKVGKDDLVEQYLFLTTSHNGYGSITAAFTPIRIVCNNTLNAAFRNCSNSIKIRHTASAKDRLEEAHKVMGISNRLSEYLQTSFNQWATVRITDMQLRKLIQLAMVPNKEVLKDLEAGLMDELSTQYNNMCDNVFEYALTSPTQQTETTKGTVFGAYNAVTGYFQNVRSYKNGEAKLKSLLFGGTAQTKTQKAFDLCENFAAKGDGILNLN
jgi:phage/plasmid-like protein (TIGR03299 family)